MEIYWDPYINFLEETELNRTRPHHQSIMLSDPSGYAELLGHIYLHGQVMEQVSGTPVPMSEAAANWYDDIFRPAVTLIRKHEVLQRSGEDEEHTEADLYMWMVDHLRDIRRQYGSESETKKFSHALVDYLAEKKIAIPRELLDEQDETVVLSRSQILEQIKQRQIAEQRARNQE